MDDDDFGIAALEDPAPKQATPSVYENVGTSDRKATKRRLRYRPDIDVSGTKYKGRRVSRSDIDLATDFGIQDRDPANQSDKGGDATDEDGLSDADADLPSLDLSSAQIARQREEEERAITERLIASKRSDDLRSVAVRTQKSIYDAVVNMRIRLEPLIGLARKFPSKDQRADCKEWNIDEKLDEALQSSQNGLQSLVSTLEAAWSASWPEVSENRTDKVFEQWRDAVLNQWGRKVEDAAGVVPKEGFKAFDTSVSSQLKAALKSGKQLDRTRRVREPITLLGGIEFEAGSHDIQYDDGEFYRTLLREIIETGDAPGGGLRYAQLSKQGRIKKRKTKLPPKSKRIKYEVHEKMVGFLAPVPVPDPGPVDEIIANLFGKQQFA